MDIGYLIQLREAGTSIANIAKITGIELEDVVTNIRKNRPDLFGREFAERRALEIEKEYSSKTLRSVEIAQMLKAGLNLTQISKELEIVYDSLCKYMRKHCPHLLPKKTIDFKKLVEYREEGRDLNNIAKLLNPDNPPHRKVLARLLTKKRPDLMGKKYASKVRAFQRENNTAPKKINSKRQEFIRNRIEVITKCLEKNMKRKEIAKELNIKYVTLCNWTTIHCPELLKKD